MAQEALLARDLMEPEPLSAPARRETTTGQLLEFPAPPRPAIQPTETGLPTVAAPRPSERSTSVAEPSEELTRCENFFFAFDFPYLVFEATLLIEQGTAFGDAYAYRCFALLGEMQQGVKPDMECDVMDLLRDYFRACERPMSTDGAIVCRLFLKLLFGDLVRRIARAQNGCKFELEKSDPLCGGAHAIFEGDFWAARRMFEAASTNPATSDHAWAGMGLLHLFDSDLPSAVDAFSWAGKNDEDIVAIAQLIRS